jgi:steroid 5-alpha reductase family enzyme
MIFFIAIVVIFFHMSLVWLWYRYTQNPSVVDVGWASGLTIIGMLYLYCATGADGMDISVNALGHYDPNYSTAYREGIDSVER